MLRFFLLSAAMVVAALADGTTQYNWQQHTGNNGNGNGHDWGQYTKPTQAPGQGDKGTTVYNWQQHTGNNGNGNDFDWGKYTQTQRPGQERTTYNWQQHTQTYGPDYDWGQHTKPPGNGNGDSNGGDHGNNNGNGDHNVGNDNNNNGDEDHNDRPNFKCGSGTYTCAGTVGLCIKLNQICDGNIDCPHGDDEDRQVCGSGLIKPSQGSGRGRNGFRGTGFMFHIGKMQIKNKSNTKFFNQNSDSQTFIKPKTSS